jgi:hypothetical protein
LRISIRHVGIVVEPEPIVNPFSDIARHMMKAIGTHAPVMRIDSRKNRDLMDMMPSKHCKLRIG